jgi:hypothetical protein
MSKRLRWICLGCAILGLVTIVCFATVARSRKNQPPVSSERKVTLSMDAEGRARIGGVTIGNTNVRDASLGAIKKLDLGVKVEVPKTMTNAEQASNFIKTLEAAGRAGLFDQNPNPYE